MFGRFQFLYSSINFRRNNGSSHRLRLLQLKCNIFIGKHCIARQSTFRGTSWRCHFITHWRSGVALRPEQQSSTGRPLQHIIIEHAWCQTILVRTDRHIWSMCLLRFLFPTELVRSHEDQRPTFNHNLFILHLVDLMLFKRSLKTEVSFNSDIR